MKILVEFIYTILRDRKNEDYPFEQREIVTNEINKVLQSKNIEIPLYISNFEGSVQLEDYVEKIPIEKHNVPFDTRHLYVKNLNFKIKINLNYKLAYDFHLKGHENDYNIKNSEDIELTLLDIIPYDFTDWIYEIILLAQLARPGCLKISNGGILCNNKLHSHRLKSINDYRYAMLNNRTGYPTVSFLNFYEFYNWIVLKKSLFPINPTNAFQKSLNNLTHIDSTNSLEAMFIYQMRILEDIYTKGNNQISDQLHHKIQIFLGFISYFKNQIKKMYDVRSRFLHGDSYLAPYHKIDLVDFEETDKDFDHDFEEAHTKSLLLVIATLQKMYLENRMSLDFELKLRN